MTLVNSSVSVMKTSPRTSPRTKIAVPDSLKKSSSTVQKPLEGGPLVKKPITASTVGKSKSTLLSTKSPSKIGKPTVRIEHLPNSVEKSPSKSTITKTSSSSTIKAPLSTTKSPSSGIRTPIRNPIKTPITVKTPERKELVSKKETPTQSPKQFSPRKTITDLPSLSRTTRVNSSVNSSPGSNFKLTSSPSKPSITREVKLGTAEKTKDIKPIKVVSKSPLKKTIVPSQSAQTKVNSLAKSKSNTKISPTTKIVKKDSTLSKSISSLPNTAVNIVDVQKSVAVIEEKNICQCIDVLEKCDELPDKLLMTAYSVNDDFNVVQAFKVAEQLIQIQNKNDRNLETIIETCENNSTINWEDIITPCDNFIISSSDDDGFKCAKRDSCSDIPFNVSESNLKCFNCTDEVIDLNYSHGSDLQEIICKNYDDPLIISENCDNNQNIENFLDTTDTSCTSEKSTENVYVIQNNQIEIETNDDNNFTNKCSTERSNDFSSEEHEQDFLSSARNIPEWTITIDEFSIDINKKENESPEFYENIPSRKVIVDETSCSGSLSYAEVLKKSPRVLANTTNTHPRLNKSNSNVNLDVKKYYSLKNVESLSSTNIAFNELERSYQFCEYDGIDEELECAVFRKRNYKKIKHFSKRHLKNSYINCKYIESCTDVFVTPVWRNIY